MGQETKQRVTKDMTMGEIIQKWPAAADIMQSYGLHCFGCHINLFESLEQGVLAHGMDEKIVDSILDELNNLANSKPVEEKNQKHSEDVSLTELAATKLKELAEKEGKQGYGIRVAVVKGGCAGYMYNIEFRQKQQTGDHVIESHGLKLFADDNSYNMLKGVVIDYAETLQGAGFKFENPNASASCGCGKSFH